MNRIRRVFRLSRAHDRFRSPVGCWLRAISPEEALKRMKVADGFEVKLVASEPIIRQPVTMTFDDRGRIGLFNICNIPNPAGSEAGQGRSISAHRLRPHAGAAAEGTARRRSHHDSRRPR